MNIETIEELLKTVTDKVTALDDLVRGKKDMYFRCSHSGLLFPADYLKEWGRKYGVGLGPDPVSECLDTDYTQAVVKRESVRCVEDCIHPFGITRSQVDCVFLAATEYTGMLILDAADQGYHQRTRIIRAKQLDNPRSKIRNMIMV